MNVERELFLAVDIGGTKIAVGLVDRVGHILAYNQDSTCQMGPQKGIQQIINLLEAVVNQQRIEVKKVTAIGIGIPAVLEPASDKVIWAPNLNGWKNIDLRGAIEAYFHVPVYIEYDGHAAVLGEWWIGSGKAYHTLVDIIIGTGVGGGMIINGELFRGNNRLAGAMGWFRHSINDEKTLANGCWESRISGPAITRRAQELTHADGGLMWMNLAAEGQFTSETLFELAKQGDQAALQLCNQIADEIGMGVANVVSMMNPQLVILGGGVGSNCGFLLPRIRNYVKEWAQPISARSLEIMTSNLGSQAGLLGAAYAAVIRNEENQ